MSHTNQTPNYHLPQFIGTDKPAWLVDFNQAMSDIDTQMKANATAGATAEANAQSALSGLSATNTQVSGLQTDVSAIQTQMPLDEAQIATNAQNISTQASAIVNANNRIDTLNGKVGDLADLDTTDKTSIVNAVNEVKADIDDDVVEVTPNANETWGSVFNRLHALISGHTLTRNAKITYAVASVIAVAGVVVVGENPVFVQPYPTASYLGSNRIELKSSNSVYYTVQIANGGALTLIDGANTECTATKVSLYFK